MAAEETRSTTGRIVKVVVDLAPIRHPGNPVGTGPAMGMGTITNRLQVGNSRRCHPTSPDLAPVYRHRRHRLTMAVNTTTDSMVTTVTLRRHPHQGSTADIQEAEDTREDISRVLPHHPRTTGRGVTITDHLDKVASMMSDRIRVIVGVTTETTEAIEEEEGATPTDYRAVLEVTWPCSG
jgi:hypothetical protein